MRCKAKAFVYSWLQCFQLYLFLRSTFGEIHITHENYYSLGYASSCCLSVPRAPKWQTSHLSKLSILHPRIFKHILLRNFSKSWKHCLLVLAYFWPFINLWTQNVRVRRNVPNEACVMIYRYRFFIGLC